MPKGVGNTQAGGDARNLLTNFPMPSCRKTLENRCLLETGGLEGCIYRVPKVLELRRTSDSRPFPYFPFSPSFPTMSLRSSGALPVRVGLRLGFCQEVKETHSGDEEGFAMRGSPGVWGVVLSWGVVGIFLPLAGEGTVAPAEGENREGQGMQAEVVYRGGRIWTGEAAMPEASALAVWGGRIVAIGSEAEVKPWIGPATEVVELEGRRVVPGFIDAHVHLLGGGLQLARVDLRDARDEAEFGRRLQEFDRKTPRDRWLLGGNWDQERTLGGRLPTAALLDKYVKDRPVFLRRYDGHMGVANRAALRAAGISRATAEVEGGVIDRDEQGEPTGILRDNAMALVERVIPEPSDEEIAEAVRAALAHAASVGVTGVDDMDGSTAETRRRLLRVLQHLERQGRLSCRIHLRWPLSRYRELAELGLAGWFGSPWLRIGGVKGFVDGSLGSSTARMWEPYENQGGNRGVYITPVETLRAWIRGADEAGLPVCIHAIGDEANTVLLDLYEQIQRAQPGRERRFRIEHAQHLREADYARFRQLGVIASMQPYHAIDDGRWAEGRIGPRRCARSYAFRSLLETGAILAFGSDWPVVPLSPLLGIEAAVNRRTLDGKHPHGWHPHQRISVREAVRAYTWGSAYATATEQERGTLALGKWADFVVLDRDIFDPQQQDHLAQTQVLRTVVAGKTVYIKR